MAQEATGGTRDKLIAAAASEFGEHGFLGTDSNKIARRAGFAPQTFYRQFKDKTEILLAVLAAREAEDLNLIGWLLVGEAPEATRIESAIQHFRRLRPLRRSLARLAHEDAAVRAAIAEARARQIAQVRLWAPPSAGVDDSWLVSALITLERLIDAVAEGELADMGLGDSAARTVIGRIAAGIRVGQL